MADPTVSSIVDRSGDPASVAWAHDGVGDVAKLPNPLAAIAAAAELGNAKALQSVQAPKDLRKAASAALHKLKSKGLKIEEVAPARSFTLGKESFDLPSRAFISIPDLDGDMEFLLTTSDPGGNCALGVIFGAGQPKEMRHAHVGRGELRDLWKQADGRKDLAEIPFTTGLHYIERFAAGAPDYKHDWTHFLEHVPAATLQAARTLDPLGKAPTDAVDEDGIAWIAPPGVLDHGALSEGMDRLVALTSAAYADDAARDAAYEALYVEVADRALADGDRAALVRAAELAVASFAFHRRPKAAASVRAQAEAAAAGASGSALESVLTAVRLLLLSNAQRHLGDRIEDINRQMAGAGPDEG